MKYQLYILLQVIKKSWLWLSFIICLFIFNIISNEITIYPLVAETNIYPMMSYPSKSFLLLTFCQIIFSVYFLYYYYTYEMQNSYENTILRINCKKWISIKLFYCALLSVMVRTILTLITYFIYQDILIFSLSFLIYPVIYYILLSLIVITLSNLVKINILNLIFIFVFCFLTFAFFNIWVFVLIVLILLIFNYMYFKFKRLFEN